MNIIQPYHICSVNGLHPFHFGVKCTQIFCNITFVVWRMQTNQILLGNASKFSAISLLQYGESRLLTYQYHMCPNFLQYHYCHQENLYSLYFVGLSAKIFCNAYFVVWRIQTPFILVANVPNFLQYYLCSMENLDSSHFCGKFAQIFCNTTIVPFDLGGK